VGEIDGTGETANFRNPTGICLDTSGNLYTADFNRIRKITPSGVVSTFATGFNQPYHLAFDTSGYLYVADENTHSIKKVSPEGVVSTAAGVGVSGYLDGSAGTAKFNFPYGVTVDSSNNLYVADTINNRIRKIDPQGLVSNLAGTGAAGAVDGTGGTASFERPIGISVDTSGHVYVADYNNHRIRKISPEGVVSTLVGSSEGNVNGAVGTAKLAYPTGISINTNGDLYIAEYGNSLIRKISLV
jgi:streptogramin lyase